MNSVYGKVVVTLMVPNYIPDDDGKVQYSKKTIFSQPCEMDEAEMIATKFHDMTGRRFRTESTTQFVPNPVDLDNDL